MVKTWGVPERAEVGSCSSHREVPLRCFGFIWKAVEESSDAGRTGSDVGYLHKGPLADACQPARVAGCRENGLETCTAARSSSEHFLPLPVLWIPSFSLLQETALATITSEQCLPLFLLCWILLTST